MRDFTTNSLHGSPDMSDRVRPNVFGYAGAKAFIYEKYKYTIFPYQIIIHSSKMQVMLGYKYIFVSLFLMGCPACVHDMLSSRPPVDKCNLIYYKP